MSRSIRQLLPRLGAIVLVVTLAGCSAESMTSPTRPAGKLEVPASHDRGTACETDGTDLIAADGNDCDSPAMTTPSRSGYLVAAGRK